MTETGWIIVGVVVVLAIIALVLLRRKPAASVTPKVEAPAPAPVPTPTPKAPPQTIAAEETPPPAPEPVAAAPVVEEAPLSSVVVEPVAPTPAAVATGEDSDNLLKLKGVGPKIATLLQAEGITRYAQIAAWSDTDIAAIDAKLGSFAGRPRRDNWVDQASLLAAGDKAGYEAKYGKL